MIDNYYVSLLQFNWFLVSSSLKTPNNSPVQY